MILPYNRRVDALSHLEFAVLWVHVEEGVIGIPVAVRINAHSACDTCTREKIQIKYFIF